MAIPQGGQRSIAAHIPEATTSLTHRLPHMDTFFLNLSVASVIENNSIF